MLNVGFNVFSVGVLVGIAVGIVLGLLVGVNVFPVGVCVVGFLVGVFVVGFLVGFIVGSLVGGNNNANENPSGLCPQTPSKPNNSVVVNWVNGIEGDGVPKSGHTKQSLSGTGLYGDGRFTFIILVVGWIDLQFNITNVFFLAPQILVEM